jgi:hypothetical protein
MKTIGLATTRGRQEVGGWARVRGGDHADDRQSQAIGNALRGSRKFRRGGSVLPTRAGDGGGVPGSGTTRHVAELVKLRRAAAEGGSRRGGSEHRDPCGGGPGAMITAYAQSWP